MEVMYERQPLNQNFRKTGTCNAGCHVAGDDGHDSYISVIVCSAEEQNVCSRKLLSSTTYLIFQIKCPMIRSFETSRILSQVFKSLKGFHCCK